MAHAFRLARLSTPTHGLGHRLVTAAAWIERVLRIHRERRRLIALDACALKDIGLSRADAYGEWSRPFWDLPRDR